MAARTWGIWTEAKLEILAEYLPRFTTAAKNKADGVTVYLDLFSGEPDNFARGTQRKIDGSARRALACSPPFKRVCLFELCGPAEKLRRALELDFPGRDLRVYPGDCNLTIDDALSELVQDGLEWAPTFAFIDPYAAEIRWSTLEKLAAHKKRSSYKVELWMLFAHAQLPRGLGVNDGQTYESFAPKTTQLFGCDDWKRFHEARKSGRITPEEFRAELLNLMRWRLERDLGYRSTHALELKNTNGSPIYSMIFATDNAAGDRIMSWIYADASRRHPQMWAEAAALRQGQKEESEGRLALFEPLPKVPDAPVPYEHVPPHEPPWFSSQP